MVATTRLADWGIDRDWATPRDPFATFGWSARERAPYDYRPGSLGEGNNYAPGVGGMPYDPPSGFTSRWINSEIERWMQAEYPELYDWSTGNLNSSGGGGNVATGTIGQFDQDPSVYAEIETAANKYGVPANLLKAVIARESSGDWNANARSVASVRGGAPIFGYVGVFFDAARSWGFDPATLEGNRAGQIAMLASGLRGFYERSPGKKWEEAVSMHFSGNWQPSGYIDELGNSDSAYLSQVMSWWQQDDNWVKQNGGTVGGGSLQGGMGAVNSPQWQPVNQWDSIVAEAASQYGIPANLLKAIMRVESGGDPNAISPAGATGLMQVMPGMHGLNAAQLRDPRANVLKGAEILRQNFDQWGSWQAATQAYLGGTPGSNASDGFNTQGTYWNAVNGYWQELNAATSGMFNGPEGAPGAAVSTIDAIWGGPQEGIGEISQEHGPNAFASANPGWYEYSLPLLGALGHPGLDISMPLGTQLYSPVDGTVVVAGPEGGYRLGANMDDYTPQTGELRIRMDNGHEVILGHMAGIHVTVGTRVRAGQAVGLSGTAGTGQHAHLEYRIPSNRFGGTQEAIDPRQALAGLFTGSLSGNLAGPGAQPMSYRDVLKAAATGAPTGFGMTLAQRGTWNSALLAAMRGELPFVPLGEVAPTRTSSTGYVFAGGLGSSALA